MVNAFHKGTRWGVAAISLLLIVGCAPSNQGASSSKETTTSVELTTTTLAPPDCSLESVSTAAGEEFSKAGFACSGGWVAGASKAYWGSCGECESMWIFQWEGGAWQMRGQCMVYSTLTEMNCSPKSGELNSSTQLEKMVDFPSKEVACAIWPTNRMNENVAETGCVPDPS